MKRNAKVAIPGVDLASLVQFGVLALPIAVVLGWQAMPVYLLVVVFSKVILQLWVRHFGAPLANAAIDRERVLNVRVLIGVLAAVMLLGLLGASRLLVAGVALAVLCWFRPSTAALLLVFAGLSGRSELLLVVVPAVIMLARRDQRVRFGLPRSAARTAMTVFAAAIGFLLVLPFVNSTVGSAEIARRASPPSTSRDGGEQSFLERVTAWLTRSEGGSSPGRLVRVPDAPDPAEADNGFPWQLWLAIALGVAVVVAILLWWRRRGREMVPAGSDGSSWSLARLERIGETTGRSRAPHEGALTYAGELTRHTGDPRLAHTGPLVSGAVYASPSTDPAVVGQRLAAVEADPPPPPPVLPVADRLARWWEGSPLTGRGVALTGIGITAIAVLAWLVVPHLGDRREPDRELAYSTLTSAPAEWHELMTSGVGDLVAWESCTSAWGDTVTWAQAGLVHLDKPLSAHLAVNPMSGSATGEPLRASVSLRTADRSAIVSVPLVDSVPLDGAATWHDLSAPVTPVKVFDSVDEVVAAFDVTDPIRTELIDRNGDRFSRFESFPVEEFVGDTAASQSYPQLGFAITDLMWVLDVWVDDGMVTRVRAMSDEPARRWFEWRRLASPTSDRLRLAECPAAAPFDGGPWFGRESWTPTRTIPPLISFDDQGHPYDDLAWSDASPVTETLVGQLPGPVPTLSIGDLFALATERETAEIWTGHVDWTQGATITAFEQSGWPVAVRIDGVDADAVVAWDAIHAMDIYESFVSLTAAADFPPFEWEGIESLIEPLWEGSPLERGVVVAGEPEVVVLTQSDANAVVVGRDHAGRIVSVLVWDRWIEWRRLAISDLAPPEVIEREAELRACLAGERALETSGECRR